MTKTRRDINRNMHPAGGFTFDDPSKVTFEAPSLDQLVSKVRAYRAAYKPLGDLPTDNIRQEIIDQICDRDPSVAITHIEEVPEVVILPPAPPIVARIYQLVGTPEALAEFGHETLPPVQPVPTTQGTTLS